jgi:hypothetical protein
MENQKNNSPDEIDLQELAVAIIRFLRKHFVVITLFSLVGMGCAWMISSNPRKIYVGKMIVLSDVLTTESYGKEVTAILGGLIRSGNRAALALRLHLDSVEVTGISSLEIETIKEKRVASDDVVVNEKDLLPEQCNLVITAEVTNKAVLPKLQSGLLQFFRDADYVQIRVRQRKEMYKALMEKTAKEIHFLDSLKKRASAGASLHTRSAEAGLDPATLYPRVIDLNKELITYKNSLELADSIQLIEGFTAYDKPASRRMLMQLAIGFFAGLFAAIGLLLATQLVKLSRSSTS